MEKEFSAKTIEEAKELAAKEFGVSADEIEFDILEQPRKTLFGGLKGEARVNAIYEPAAEEPKKRIFEDDEEDEEAAEESAPEALDDEQSDDEEEALPEDFDVSKSLKVKTAIEYLTAVLKALGLEKFTITPEKRGETLDSLQYLTILASNRTEESFCRISLDCNGYRDKRRETLDALARKTSAKVIKQGRKIALEPMNPYERRIIHSCVAEIEGVSSRSTGSEPFRKVVIYADKPKFDNNRRRGGNHGNGSGARGYRRSEGFSTSFEREYKRSSYSPDENANAGEFSKETVDTEKNATLYGKIEL